MKARRIVTAAAAVLAACGALGGVPAAAQAGSASAPAWTQQTPAAQPPARSDAAMAYDTATGTAVLFGGNSSVGSLLGDTWTWDGTTWTKQHPATSPPAMAYASMAYDAATGTVMLFGGYSTIGHLHRGHLLRGTWTWDGTTWTKQAPATSPPARYFASMAYDAATGAVMLFGGYGGHSPNGVLADTWTWDGTTWTKQHPAAHPAPRGGESMAYDAATGTVVLFGGNKPDRTLVGDGTWTWDGTAWTKQAPATRPSARILAAIAYDAATGTVVLFGGLRSGAALADTWTWDGTTWTKQAPTTSPSARLGAAIAYDAATGTVVLFGGDTAPGYAGDTWTWG